MMKTCSKCTELEADNLRLRAELEGTREKVVAVDQRRADVGNEMLDWRRKAELAQAECDAWRIKFTAIMKALGATFYDDTGAEMEP